MNKKEYLKLLRSMMWQKKRLEKLASRDWMCELCGAGENENPCLQVHHKYYKQGCYPWSYPDNAFQVLCEACHESMEMVKIQRKYEKEAEDAVKEFIKEYKEQPKPQPLR